MKRRNIFKLALGAIAGAFTGFTGKKAAASPTTADDDQNWIIADDWLPPRFDHNRIQVHPYKIKYKAVGPSCQVDGLRAVINPDWVNAPLEAVLYHRRGGKGIKLDYRVRKP